jgi:hypothetical protein
MNLNKVKKYIDENNKKPSPKNKDKNINFLGEWISSQLLNYKNKEFNMKDKNIYNKWTEFINNDKYKQYFQSQEEDFIMNLNEVKKYIDKNNKRPTETNINDTKLSKWLQHQISNYNNKKYNMKDDKIYNKWTEFINSENYKEYFKVFTMEESFNINLDKVKKYIDENNKRPSSTNKDINIQYLGSWINTQNNNFKTKEKNMKNENIYNKWNELINSEKYQEHCKILTMEEDFTLNLKKIKNYIDNNNKKPSTSNKDKNIKILGTWISTQQYNYLKKEQNMKDDNVYKKWTDFINDNKYKKYFNLPTIKEIFNKNLYNVKKYIDEYNKRPSSNDIDKYIKSLSQWLSHQTTNYSKKQFNMKNEIIYNKWTEFINDNKYKKYFNN